MKSDYPHTDDNVKVQNPDAPDPAPPTTQPNLNRKKHKWLRRGLETLLCLIIVILLIPVLIYIPPVQSLLVRTAAGFVADKTGMKIGIEKFRLKFPLDISLQGVSVIEASGDTMVLAKEVVADLKLMPLLHLDAKINRLKLVDARYRMLSPDSSMLMVIKAGLLTVDDRSGMDLGKNEININEALLKDGDISLTMDVWKQTPSPADSTSTPFLIRANRLRLEGIRFTMSMLPTIDTLLFSTRSLTLENGVIDLRQNKMSLGKVKASTGYAEMLAPSVEYVQTHPAPQPQTTENLQSSTSPSFVIKADSISLTGFGARYAVKDSPEVDGFDSNDIRAEDLSIILADFYNRATDISLPITALSASLLMGHGRNVLSQSISDYSDASDEIPQIRILPDSHGTFSMDSTGLSLTDFFVHTPNSRISATASIPNALLEMMPSALLDVDVDASLGLQDVNAFMPDLTKYTNAIPSGTPINAVLKASGLLGNPDINCLDVRMPGVVSLRANGKVDNLFNISEMVAHLKFEGELQKPSIVNNFVETQGVDIPALSIKGVATANRENYTADFSLHTAHGDLVGNGRVGMNSEAYQANINVRNLNIGSFIGDKTMGPLTANLSAKGAGFNPEKHGAHTEINMKLDRFVYNNQTLRDIDLIATLADGAFTIDANSYSQPLFFNIAGKGSIAEDFYQADIIADLKKVDLHLLGLSDTTNYGSGRIHVFGNASPRTWIYDVSLDVEKLDWHLPAQDITLADGANARLVSGADDTRCSIDANGVSVEFLSGVGLKSLVDSFSAVGQMMSRTLEQKRVDVEAIESKLPPFSLKANVDGKGVVDEFLRASDMQVGNLKLDLSKDSVLQGNAVLNSLKTQSMSLDTITFGLKSRGQLIDYQVHLGNRPGTLDEFADVNVRGYIGENRLSAYLVQHNIKRRMGYRLGFTASVADSIMSVRFTPLKATIAYLPWKFNSANYLDYNLNNNKLTADLEASSEESSILLRTEKTDKGEDALHLNLKNIRVQDFLQMALNAPPVKANVNSDIMVRYTGRALVGKGSLDINDFIYDRKRVGDFSFTLAAGRGNKGKSAGKIGLLIDNAQAAAVQFVLAPDSVNPSGGLTAERLNLKLTRFPLSIANPFLAPDVMKLSGALNGDMAMSGSFTNPKLNGSIESDSIGVYINMLGTTLRFGRSPVVVADNVLKFDNFNISAVNDNPLSINGVVDASKFTDIIFDISAVAKNMQLVGGKKSKADITGNLFVDLGAKVKGPMSRMNIDASLDVLPATDVTYNMFMGGNDMLAGQGSADDVVRFVNFADSTLVAKADSLQSSMSMRITAKVVISQGTQVAVNLMGDLVTGGGKIECNPSGTLNYFQNYMGDMKLNGTLYTGTGYANYSIPVIGKKMFNFDRNSYISWNGDILNPTLAISATDEVKANIQMNGSSRLVNFIVGLNIGNTLSAPSVNFDLSTNDDMSISNELQSMTPEQRMQQAMNLLLTGSYAGLNAKSVKSNLVSTGTLYNFLAGRLNAFAAQNLKGVDLNFGVNQYEVGQNGSTSTNTSYTYQLSKSLINNRFKILVGGNYSPDASADENFQQNLISDIAFEYILRQTNTMSLNAKLFRHTGFESILEGEITETGVGLTLRRRLAYFTEITHFGLSKLWKKPKKTEAPAPSDSPAPSDNSDNSDSSDNSDNNAQ